MNRSLFFRAVAAAAAVALSGCDDAPAPTELASGAALAASVAPAEYSGRHIVLFAAERVPADFGDRVSKLGGTVEASLDNIGVAVVTGLTDAAAAELAAEADIRNVETDVVMTLEAVDASADEATSAVLAPADATASPTSAEFYARQWNMRAVFAPEAWAAGHLGSRDVVVAILDTASTTCNPTWSGSLTSSVPRRS